eukprot:696189-Alexandrium_andersonii.AAC.1
MFTCDTVRSVTSGGGEDLAWHRSPPPGKEDAVDEEDEDGLRRARAVNDRGPRRHRGASE